MPTNEQDIYSQLSSAWGRKKEDSDQASTGRPMTPQELLLFQAMQGSALTGYRQGYAAGQQEARKPKSIGEAFKQPVHDAFVNLASQAGNGLSQVLEQLANGDAAIRPTIEALTPQPHVPSEMETRLKKYAADTAKRAGRTVVNWAYKKLTNRG